jgi:hypothetical protein
MVTFSLFNRARTNTQTHTYTIARMQLRKFPSLSLFLYILYLPSVSPYLSMCPPFSLRIVVVPATTLSLLELDLVLVSASLHRVGMMPTVRQLHPTEFVRWAVHVTGHRSRVTISVTQLLVVPLLPVLGILKCI